MDKPRSRARLWRGTLVGACAADLTIGAHAAAGGPLPDGPALALAVSACSMSGAAVAGAAPDGRRARFLGIAGALCAAQLVGHLVLSGAGGHGHHHHHHHDHLQQHSAGAGHPSGGWASAAAMIAAHAAAALVLGAAIAAVEYLYAVCVSVLHWLRLFGAVTSLPTVRVARWTRRIVVAQPVLLRCGLGMRAPPSVPSAC